MPTCDIELTAYTPPQSIRGNCTGVIMEQSRCGIYIHSKAYSDVYEIPLDAAETGRYQYGDDFYELFLKTGNITHNSIWKEYRLPPIQVLL